MNNWKTTLIGFAFAFFSIWGAQPNSPGWVKAVGGAAGGAGLMAAADAKKE